MSRVVLFLLGLLIGAGGVYALFWNGTLDVPSPSPSPSPVAVETGAPAISASVGAAAVPTNEVVLPELPSSPAPSTSIAVAPAPMAPLPGSVAASGAEPSAVEQPPDAPSAEGTAAVTAAVV